MTLTPKRVPHSLGSLLAKPRCFFTLLLSVALLYGCETTRMTPSSPGLEPASLTIAEKAERDGEYVLAAREYLRLAQTASPPQQQNFQLQSVATLLKAGQLREAHQQVEMIDVSQLDSSYVARKRILQARLLTLEGSHEKAIRMLDDAGRARNLSPEVIAEIYHARAQTELVLNNPIGAVRNFILREQYIAAKEVITEGQQQLWKILVALPRARLATELNIARDPALAGWIELAQISADYSGNSARIRSALEQWKKTYPNHPAEEALLRSLAVPGPELIGHIERIALLLPLTSQYATAAQAVRDGFQAMAAVDATPGKPKITVYDIGADATKASEYYATAVSDGGQFIVGPLGREAAEVIMRHANLKVPTLMLSHTDEDPGAAAKYLFQFGLPPEQEARQVAERAYLDGHRRAGVLYPQSPWGERMMTAWASHWQRLGGTVVSSQAYNEGESDFSDTIKRLLNIAQSEERKQQLDKLLGQRLRFEARARQDIDYIFLAATADFGRLLKPQLNFYHAARVPVYSTSHIFTGKGDPIRDVDLDGILFGDMPWMLVGDGNIQALRQKLQQNWPYAHSDLDRLYALGVDSYAIVPHLNKISAKSSARFSGVTSGLSLESNGQLHRQLLWARFQKGVPRLMDTFLKHKNQFEIQDGAE